MLCLEDLSSVRVPTYIDEGLEWLQQKLLRRQEEVQIDATKEPAQKVEGD